MTEGAHFFDVGGGGGDEEMVHCRIYAALGGHFQKGVGDGVLSEGMGQQQVGLFDFSLQATRQHPATQKIITGRREPFTATADEARRFGDASGYHMAKGLLKKGVSILLLFGDVVGRREKGNEAFGWRLMGQERFERP